MSQNITAFFEKVQTSPELQQKLEAIEEKLLPQKAELIASLSAEVGTPFSAADFLSAVSAMSKELDDDELNAVAGGSILLVRDLRKVGGYIEKFFSSL